MVVPDLFGQGELAANVVQEKSQRMWFQRGGDKDWHRFSGYTYGFNHCLFAQRVHDLLSLIVQAGSEGEVCMVGRGQVAGPLVAAACSQASKKVKRCIIDPKGFKFTSIDRHDDPMFVPGAVKYLGLDGLISLAAPVSLVISGDEYPIARKVYAANGTPHRLKLIDDGIEGSDLLAELQVQD